MSVQGTFTTSEPTGLIPLDSDAQRHLPLITVCIASQALGADRLTFADTRAKRRCRSKGPPPMTIFSSFASMSLLPVACADTVLHRLFEEPTKETLAAYEDEYAHRAGYAMGPHGEWIVRQSRD
jgi:hypothetical protein